jgi:hypothetical protein
LPSARPEENRREHGSRHQQGNGHGRSRPDRRIHRAARQCRARTRPRLARTFPAQIEALTRHRNNGEAAITVQNVSVGDGGKAVVGNVTLHARVIIADKNPA